VRTTKYMLIVLVVIAGLMSLSVEGWSQEARRAVIDEIKGVVDVRINGGEWQLAELGMVLYEKDEIRTANGAFAKLYLDNRGATGQIELKEDSLLRVHTIHLDPVTGDKNTYLDLAIGKVLIQAEKLQGDSKFEVRTPNASAGVRGTLFEVSVDK